MKGTGRVVLPRYGDMSLMYLQDLIQNSTFYIKGEKIAEKKKKGKKETTNAYPATAV